MKSTEVKLDVTIHPEVWQDYVDSTPEEQDKIWEDLDEIFENPGNGDRMDGFEDPPLWEMITENGNKYYYHYDEEKQKLEILVKGKKPLV